MPGQELQLCHLHLLNLVINLSAFEHRQLFKLCFLAVIKFLPYSESKDIQMS